MKKLISSIMLALIALVAQAQILTPVKWKIKLDDKGGAPEKEIVFTATADKGWHLYDMNLPEGGPVSTSFTFETLNGAELIGQPVPSVKPTTVYDEQFAMNLRWYPGTVSFIQKLKVTDPAKFKVEGEVEFMACNDETCLPPDQIPFSFDKKSIHVDPALAANSSTTEVDKEDATTVQPDTQVVAEDASELNTPDPTAKETPATTSPKASDSLTDSPNLWSPVIDQLKAFGDSTVSAADTSWLFIFFAGFLGGLIALLTPCVWPMIPMTVSFFLKRTKDRKKAIRDAITYGLSIIVIYLVMGLLITGIFGASALNDLSTNAIFNILFFLLLVVFAVSFFGAFELVLPALHRSAQHRAAFRQRENQPLDAGRSVHRRHRARYPAPAVQPLLHEGAARLGDAGLRRAVQEPAVPGHGARRARRRHEQVQGQRYLPRGDDRGLRLRRRACLHPVHGSAR